MNAGLIANRAAKASRFVDFLDEHMPMMPLALVEQLTDDEWAHIADLAGEQSPSASTRSAILVGLRERRSPSRQPLEGLPR